ncbi:MAG: cysteine desulfurase family protein [Acidimicrobiales bacterium]
MRAYLDHAASAPLRPEATQAMLPWLTGRFGNPSGSHQTAREARRAVEEAREAIAGAMGGRPGEIVLTGGGTEADFLALHGVLRRRRVDGRDPGAIVTTAIEHPAVRRAAESAGVPVREVPVGRDGVVDLDALAAALDTAVAVVSVMLVNNEVGTLQPLAEVADVTRRLAPSAVLHTDAVQAMPWLDLRDAAAGADLVSVSGHKFGGPQGVGALLVREGTPLAAVVEGGGQERERRGGTHNVAGIAGMAAAATATTTSRGAEVAAVRSRRDRLVEGILDAVGGATPTVPAGTATAPGFAHLCIAGVESEALLVLLDDAGVSASAGSACASGALHASHVLLAMGVGEEQALGSLRLTLGPTTTDEDVDLVLDVLPAAVAKLRAG